MIITRTMAEEAAETLALDLSLPLTAEQVGQAYRLLAKAAHPDAGGSPEAFAAVDRAKHVLLGWLARSPAPVDTLSDVGEQCYKCSGKGFVVSQRGWRQMRVQCLMCRGAGTLGVEHDIGTGGTGDS